LLNKGQRPGVLDIDQVLKLLDAWDLATMHVVTDDSAILQKVAQGEEDVLRQVGHWDDEQRARLIDAPGSQRGS
jgi:hypothetical protein